MKNEDIAASVWERRHREGKLACTQRRVEGDSIDYTQHPFLYQYAVSKPTTGKLDEWIFHVIAEKYFIPPVEMMLSLGAGQAFIEEYFAAHGYVKKILAYDLVQSAVDAANLRLKENDCANILEIRCKDVLHESLPEESFNVVFVQAALHHFFKIDELFELIYRVLLPGGLLIFDEYIGPDHHIYDDEVIKILNEINDCLNPEYLQDVLTNCTRTQIKTSLEYMMENDPSEGVHATRILPLTYQYFDVIERHDYGGTLLRPFFSGILPNFDFANTKDMTVARLIILIEQLLTRNSIIPHYHTVIVGRKRTSPLSPLSKEKCMRINYNDWKL